MFLKNLNDSKLLKIVDCNFGYGKEYQIKDNFLDISEVKVNFYSIDFHAKWKIIDFEEFIYMYKELSKNRTVIIRDSCDKIIGVIKKSETF